MKILSIDTSSQNCSIAIIEVDSSNSNKITDNSFSVLSFKNSNDERTHSQKLMPMIVEMFNESNLSLENIDLIACCVGPGSFTGIRIGIATAKAFCDTQNIPVVGITSLESLAYNVEKTGYIFPIIDAKNDNIYTAGFECNHIDYSLKLDNLADNINSALEKMYHYYYHVTSDVSFYFVGNGAVLYHDLIIEKFKNKTVYFSDKNEQSAISLAKCAYAKYLSSTDKNFSSISPIYLRKSQAERMADGEPI